MRNPYLFLFIYLFSFCSLVAQEDEDDKQVSLPEITFQAEENEKIYSKEVDVEHAKVAPSLTGSFTDILKTLPYVSVNTELSSQYMVRGGNFDENLIYVNGIEVYKPQLIRSGSQEGLNFLNPNMAASVNFIPGGWEAKYGDKMSSVLDVIYRRPTEFELGAELSLMGGNLTYGNVSKDKKLSALVGARYMNRNLILNTLDEDTDFNPQSYDIQANLNYKINSKWQLSFIGNFTNTIFEQEPKSRSTDFGSLNVPINLTVYYNGKEEDKFMTSFGALSTHFKPNNRLTLSLDLYGYNSQEEEYYDIQGAYFIRNIDSDGSATTSSNIAGQYDHARNDLDLLVAGIQHRGKYRLNNNSNVEWGFSLQREDIRDLVNEWQLVDSAGYSISSFGGDNPIFPDQVDTGDLDLNYALNYKNNLTSNRYSGYMQYSKKFFLNNNTKVLVNAGVRGTYWDFNNEFNLSPRAQIAFKPDWVTTQLFRFSAGYYVQPPFYKEIRTPEGVLNPDIKAQKSLHLIGGHDFEFFMWDRPFKLTTELYYKNIDDLIPYYVDNVRIWYWGTNNAKGRSYGIDTRLYGEFIPGADSWFSLSYARAQENIDDRGWIARPTDPRFKASLFFQDYMPSYPSLKVNTTLIYASGLPNGAPLFTDPYDFQRTLSDYKRVDIGLTKVLVDQDKNRIISGFLSNFKELSVGVDVFNIFDIKNTVSNQWIRDVYSNNIYSVPNRLTGRFINFKVNMRF